MYKVIYIYIYVSVSGKDLRVYLVGFPRLPLDRVALLSLGFRV